MTIYKCPKCLVEIESTNVVLNSYKTGEYNISNDDYDFDSQGSWEENELPIHYCPACEEQIDITKLIEEEK